MYIATEIRHSLQSQQRLSLHQCNLSSDVSLGKSWGSGRVGMEWDLELRPGEESDAEFSRESSSDDLDGQPKNIQTNSRSQVDLNRLSLKDDDVVEVSNLPGLLVYQFLEREVPHFRISSLSSRCPDLNTYNSCDILPSSWVSVAWCPIYRIHMGPTLRDLEACFLTFHSLSTTRQSVSHFQPHDCAPKLGKFNASVDSSLKLPLPVFGHPTSKNNVSTHAINLVFVTQSPSASHHTGSAVHGSSVAKNLIKKALHQIKGIN
ncbi:hypothetical protein Scep_023706 [Stephania cephalantha]|uniref:Uncharacterized protein n=1 Tax=Stephania cephalantha TaxID=152367 RepID=A0AAP0HXJ0_9MAGN